MRIIGAISLCLLIACGGSKPAQESPGDDDDTLPDPGTAAPGEASPEDDLPPAETELQRRQYAACERLIPRLTECAVADARKNLPPDKLAELDLEHTAPIHTRENLKKCKKGQLSSRQVRVYEVCDREETECGPLTECLANALPKSTPQGEPEE
jgi:hypothetical protein